MDATDTAMHARCSAIKSTFSASQRTSIPDNGNCNRSKHVARSGESAGVPAVDENEVKGGGGNADRLGASRERGFSLVSDD
uniref:Uncharacterized protein n=1 Tax=Vespula pensylvanica TaxID=30213 RepID=A0A834NQ65_VESPE|nr:hypothetical protein H0235_012003 [Vespula pensylvanica]